jgi:hypothetical protein
MSDRDNTGTVMLGADADSHVSQIRCSVNFLSGRTPARPRPWSLTLWMADNDLPCSPVPSSRRLAEGSLTCTIYPSTSSQNGDTYLAVSNEAQGVGHLVELVVG